MSLTELVVASVLVGYALAVVGELVVLNTFASTKLTNKADGQVGCSRAMRRIAEDVRQARIIGNIYSVNGVNNYASGTDAGVDPSVIPPSGGFPLPPWPSIPYKLGPQTLIIQQPVLYSDSSNSANPRNGFPIRLLQGSISSIPVVPVVAMECVDTLVYQLLPDPDVPGQFMLQVARFPGLQTVPGNRVKPALNPPQTVVKGIVGPMDPANPGVPNVFQYLTSAQEVNPINVPTASQAATITGVSVKLEVKIPNSTTGANPEIAAEHVEAYLKNSRHLRLTND